MVAGLLFFDLRRFFCAEDGFFSDRQPFRDIFTGGV
jgi:hypothetical protein